MFFMGIAVSFCMKRERQQRETVEKKVRDSKKSDMNTKSGMLVSMQNEDGLVLHEVEAGEGLNYLAERGAFHGGAWSLLLAFA